MDQRLLMKDITAKAFLDRARHYCALSEQCEAGVRQKLISWGAASDAVELIVARLRADDYLNDERYARAYVESKVLHQHWGRQKVLYQLRLKHLSKEAIDASLASIDEKAYSDMLADEAAKKMRTLGEPSPDNQRRLLAFLASRGFTTDEVNRVLAENNFF